MMIHCNVTTRSVEVIAVAMRSAGACDADAVCLCVYAITIPIQFGCAGACMQSADDVLNSHVAYSWEAIHPFHGLI